MLSRVQIKQATSDKLKAYFVSVCGPRPGGATGAGESAAGAGAASGGQPLHILAASTPATDTLGGGGTRLAVRIRCNSMELAADIIQDLAR